MCKNKSWCWEAIIPACPGVWVLISRAEDDPGYTPAALNECQKALYQGREHQMHNLTLINCAQFLNYPMMWVITRLMRSLIRILKHTPQKHCFSPQKAMYHRCLWVASPSPKRVIWGAPKGHVYFILVWLLFWWSGKLALKDSLLDQEFNFCRSILSVVPSAPACDLYSYTLEINTGGEETHWGRAQAQNKQTLCALLYWSHPHKQTDSPAMFCLPVNIRDNNIPRPQWIQLLA